MKIRVKFRKLGEMKFVGHLDIMRYFQKAIRRAQIDICFSGGYSPHMVMSFASPLGVGLTSDGEYFDIEINETISSKEAVKRLNEVMVEGMEVVSFRELSENTKNAMSIVAAADYEVRFREGYEPDFNWSEKISDFYRQSTIVINKKSKKSEREVDIRSYIFEMTETDGTIFLKLASGSADNLKPELVMEAFSSFINWELSPFALLIHRKELYAKRNEENDGTLITLEELGEEIG